MRIKPNASTFLIIDLQARLLPAIEGAEAILEHTHWLLDIAQTLDIPVRATEHCPQKVGLTDTALRAKIAEESIIGKTHFSAVQEGTLLKTRPANRNQWVVVGTEAHVCVQQTVLDLLALGDEVFVVEEAVGSRRNRDKELALQRMARNGADIVSREMVAFEWLERAETAAFREILKRYIR